MTDPMTHPEPLAEAIAGLPAQIMVWKSNPKLDHTGTWSTERYPEEAVAYVPLAEIAAVLREAGDSLLECSVWCDSQERTDDGWRNGVTDARKHHMARIRALRPDATAALEREISRAREVKPLVVNVPEHGDEIESGVLRFGRLPRAEQVALFEAWLDGAPTEKYLNSVIGWSRNTWPFFQKEIYRRAALTDPPAGGSDVGVG